MIRKSIGAMKYVKLYVIAAGLMFVGTQATAQCDCPSNFDAGWCWGENPDVAKEKNALYTDAYKVENYEEAETHLLWLLENTPCLNKSIYINGAKIYEALANKEQDKTKKLEIAEKALSMYDERIKMFGEEAAVLNRKAGASYKLLRNYPSKFEEMLQLFDKAYELNGNKLFNSNIIGYMDALRRYKESGNEVADEKVFEVYFGLQEVMDYKESVGKPVSQRTRDNVENLLLRLVPAIDCEIVISDFGPKLDTNPDINMAKKIFKLMLTGKCTDHPLALKAAKMVDDNEPSYGIKLFIGTTASSNGDKETAIQYFNDAIELTDENVKKADLYLKIGRIKSSQGLKSQARDYANKALGVDPTTKGAYKLIGDLYMGSFDDCAGKDDIVKDRAVFIAAYNMYKRAGDGAAMGRAKAQFPSIAEIFENNYKEGDKMTVSCWINTSVTLERRPTN